MFYVAESFNRPLDNWDITDMTSTFAYASAFNQDLENWDTSSVTNMSGIFREATSFNGQIGNWDTSNLGNTYYMFASASSFNKAIDSWNLSNVNNMRGMFYEANSFNQNIANWDTSNIISMDNMFNGAASFNQNIGNWNISSLTSADNMFENFTLSTENYDALLMGWQAQPHNTRVHFHGGNSIPVLSLPARESLNVDDLWWITDGAGTIIKVNDEKLNHTVIYPNPSNGIFKIELGSRNIDSSITYSVTNATCQSIIKETHIAAIDTAFVLD